MSNHNGECAADGILSKEGKVDPLVGLLSLLSALSFFTPTEEVTEQPCLHFSSPCK